MLSSGIRLCLPDEVRVSLAGRQPQYRSTMQAIAVHNQHVVNLVGRADQARRNAPTEGRRNVKRGRSLGWNLVRAKRSRLCIYAM